MLCHAQDSTKDVSAAINHARLACLDRKTMEMQCNGMQKLVWCEWPKSSSI